MDFNFNSLATTSFVSSAKNYLRPYDIYKVCLTKFEKSELKGKDGVTTYPVIAVEFTGENGVHSENIFIPKSEEDFVRPENQQTHKFSPSRFEKFQFTLMQIVEAVNPKGAQSIKDIASKLKTIDDFIGVVTKAVTGKNNVEVYLKLVGQNTNGTVYSRLPNSCYISKNDDSIVASNFISADAKALNFSPYEISQRDAYQNAKPSKTEDNPDEHTEGELDLDGLEL